MEGTDVDVRDVEQQGGEYLTGHLDDRPHAPTVVHQAQERDAGSADEDGAELVKVAPFPQDERGDDYSQKDGRPSHAGHGAAVNFARFRTI